MGISLCRAAAALAVSAALFTATATVGTEPALGKQVRAKKAKKAKKQRPASSGVICHTMGGNQVMPGPAGTPAVPAAPGCGGGNGG
jgi:hypothetical protein